MTLALGRLAGGPVFPWGTVTRVRRGCRADSQVPMAALQDRARSMTKGCDSHSEITTVSSDTSDVTDRKFDLTRNFFDFGRFVWCRVRVSRPATGSCTGQNSPSGCRVAPGLVPHNLDDLDHLAWSS